MKTLITLTACATLLNASMPFSLNGGGTNTGGMNFTLGMPMVTSTSSVNTGALGVLHSIDTAAPIAYNADFDAPNFTTHDATVTLSGAEVGSQYTLEVSSSRYGSQTVSGTVTSSGQTIDIDLSSLGDGTLTFTLTLSDISGNAGSVVQGTTVLNAVNEGVVITMTDSTTSEASSDNTSSFSVKLNSIPTNDVDVVLLSDNLDEGEVTTPVAKTLTFSQADWNQNKQVVVTGVDDNTKDGDTAYNIDMTLSSTDSEFNAKTDSVSLSNTDDDVGGVNPSVIMYLLD